MKLLGIVPARAGSKRLPDKNVRMLAGKPLVRHAIDAARGARSLHRVVVSSDDSRVLAIAREVDPSLPMERPAALAGDESPAIDYVRHALSQLETEEVARYDGIVIVQPTSPFTTAGDIDATVALLERTKADSAVSVMELEHAVHPLKLKRMNEERRLLPYLEAEEGRMAAHELPRVYVRNGSVYATQRASIERGQILGDDCRGHLMPRSRSVDINDELDLRFAEFLCASST